MNDSAGTTVWHGVIPIVPTPFSENGDVDLDSLERVIDYLIAAGVDGVAVLGVASEVYALTDGERLAVLRRAQKANRNRVPLLAGTSHNSGEAAASLAREAEASGADGLLVMPPHFVKPSGEAITQYFGRIAEAVNVPIMVQDNPAWTGVQLTIDVLLRLATVSGIRYIKVETAHPPTRMRELTRVNANLTLFGGLAGNWLPEELAAGGVGTMPAAIVPQVYRDVVRLWSTGNYLEARATFNRYHPLIRVTAQQSVGFAMVKWLLWRLGLISSPTVRNPLAALSAEDRADLERTCEELAIFKLMQP